jgi:hypothetical protein
LKLEQNVKQDLCWTDTNRVFIEIRSLVAEMKLEGRQKDVCDSIVMHSFYPGGKAREHYHGTFVCISWTPSVRRAVSMRRSNIQCLRKWSDRFEMCLLPCKNIELLSECVANCDYSNNADYW